MGWWGREAEGETLSDASSFIAFLLRALVNRPPPPELITGYCRTESWKAKVG